MKKIALSLASRRGLSARGGGVGSQARDRRRAVSRGAQRSDRSRMVHLQGRLLPQVNAWEFPPSYINKPTFGINGPAFKSTVIPGPPDRSALFRPRCAGPSDVVRRIALTNELYDLAYILFANERFDDLERLLTDWTNKKERAADGRWKLGWFLEAIEASGRETGEFEARLERLDRWKAKYPHSPFPPIAEADLWRTAAWRARGSGYSSSVTPEGWRLFHERCKKAEQILLASRSYASDNPLWSLVYLETSPGPRMVDRAAAHILPQGVGAGAVVLYPIHFAMLEYLHRRWGGDWELITKLVEYAEEKTKATEGDRSMHASIGISLSATATISTYSSMARIGAI